MDVAYGGVSVIVSIIAAMDRKRGIGFDNKLPWKLSADLKRFRDLTMGHHTASLTAERPPSAVHRGGSR